MSHSPARGILRCHARIDLAQLRSNLAAVRRHAPGKQVMAMVKANAYGHGMIECARVLRREGVEYLGVAFAEEGQALRNAGDAGNILVLSPPLPQEAAMFCEYNLEFVACDDDVLSAFNHEAGTRNVKLNAHVYIDTGMHRDGIFAAQACEFADKLSRCSHLEFRGLCTHFAHADAADKTFTLQQLSLFNSAAEQLKQAGYSFDLLHAANTAAMSDIAASHFSLVRLGISLYGYPASAEIAQPPAVQPVLELRARVNALRIVEAGETVSYGRRYTAQQRERIATLSLGYGDGLMRSLSNRGHCLIRGRMFDLVGTICMDECMARVDDTVRTGDEVVIIGQQGDQMIGADRVAEEAGTIAYEVLAGISARVPRHYSDHTEAASGIENQ